LENERYAQRREVPGRIGPENEVDIEREGR